MVGATLALGTPCGAYCPKTRISFDELVSEMVREDLNIAERDEFIRQRGYKTLDRHE